MISKWVKEVCESLKNEPLAWEFGEYHAIKKGDLTWQIWSANGFWFYRLEMPFPIETSFFEKIVLHMAFKNCYKNISLIELAKKGKANGNPS